ncbi:MAG: leucine-rich repeat protein [Clostridia bacterium]|nr:leucine-rich repeat protein [Clostridia bacterium]
MNKKTIVFVSLILASFFVLFLIPSAKADNAVPHRMIRYDGNGGTSEAFGNSYDAQVTGIHDRENTLQGVSYFSREGYLLAGWNTAPDGSGIHIGLGSRITYSEGLILYAEWAEATDESLFASENGTILSYIGSGNTVVIPDTIEGQAVKKIAEGAFSNLALKSLILPPSLETIENGAFSKCMIENLTLYDRIKTLSDDSFAECTVHTVHVNAARPPVYSGSYFDTFSDKYDYLLTITDKQKLVLFSGSSGRYGYDSPAIESAFPQYRVVNMGVYAYTNALPQYELIRPLMREGDILLVAPEFDAVREQFCTENCLDSGFWAMMESNYDAAATLDLARYTNIFNSFADYQKVRSGMAYRGYGESPWSFDDDGNRYTFATYNTQGDFILPRPNSERDELHRHNIADYTTETVTPDAADSLDRTLRIFTKSGIKVYFTYAPRNRSSLTERSTKGEREAVHSMLCSRLSVPVISEIEDSLYSGIYFWNIDNHLSTEGVSIRTAQVIRDLKAAVSGGKTERPSAMKDFRIPYPAALGLYALSLLLILLGRWRRLEWAEFASGIIWATATITALVYGAPGSFLLICTLLLLLASIPYRKRGEQA